MSSASKDELPTVSLLKEVPSSSFLNSGTNKNIHVIHKFVVR